MSRVGVIGAGGWGTALARVLTGNGHQVVFWCFENETAEEINREHTNNRFLPGILLPEKLRATDDLRQAVHGQDAIVMVVPSQWTGSVAKSIAPIIDPSCLVVNAAKGLEITSLRRLSQVLIETLPVNPDRVVALSGPNHAEEVGREVPSATVVASPDINSAQEAQDLFMNAYFRVYTNPDRIGVELGGALKNIIALAAGISEGLGFGDNTKAAILTRGIAEMARLGAALGASPHTFAGLSGVGDLFVTGSSRHSRNFWAGREIGSGKSPEEVLKSTPMVVEGVPTSKAAYLLANKLNVEMPIAAKVYQVLFEGASPKQGVQELMTRGKTHESEELAKVWD